MATPRKVESRAKAWIWNAVAGAVLCTCLLHGGRARAGDFDGTIRGWYGYQILLSDLSWLGLALASDTPAFAVGGFLVGPGLVHGLNGRGGLAVLSPLYRIILPMVGIAIASQHKSCNSNGDECEMFGYFVGGGIGLGTALLLDYTLAWRRSPPATAARERATGQGQPTSDTPGRLSLTTAGLAPISNGVSLVLGGRF